MEVTSFVLAAFLLAASASSVARDLTVLRSSASRQKVADAAVRVAGSGDAAALRKLGDLLTSQAFLDRLDDTREPQAAYSNLNQVLRTLAANPSAMTEALFLKVIASDPFVEDANRQFFALPALAAVRPMSSETSGSKAPSRAAFRPMRPTTPFKPTSSPRATANRILIALGVPVIVGDHTQRDAKGDAFAYSRSLRHNALY